MKDLIFVIPHFGKSGPLNQFFYLIQEIHQEYKIKIICVLPEKDKSTLHKFSDFNIEVLPAHKRLFFINWIKILSCKFSRNKPIFHSFGLVPDFICFLLTKKKYWLSVSRNYPYEDYINKFGTFYGKIASIIHIFIQKRCQYLITCSESLSQRYDAIGIKNTPIQNCVPHHDFLSDCDQEHETFLFVGNIIQRKRVDLACELFNKIKSKNSKFNVIGEGANFVNLKNKYKNAIFYGYHNAVDKFYKESNFFINLSESEGLPNAVLEALSYGCPCILSDIPSHRELESYVSSGIYIIKDTDLDSVEAITGLIEFKDSINEDSRKRIKKQFYIRFGANKLKENFNNSYNQIMTQNNAYQN